MKTFGRIVGRTYSRRLHAVLVASIALSGLSFLIIIKQMPVSTRSKRKRWPPSGDDETITLPESMYWDFIRPFTPVEDRAVLNKRSGSTQFYAGDCANIDLSFLEKHGGT